MNETGKSLNRMKQNVENKVLYRQFIIVYASFHEIKHKIKRKTMIKVNGCTHCKKLKW